MTTARDNRQITNRLVEDIRDARNQQKWGGYDKNDKEHTNGELLDAATSYIDLAKKQSLTRDTSALEEIRKSRFNRGHVQPGGLETGYITSGPMVAKPSSWPFKDNMWAPGSYASNLTRAAALIIAELERVERADREAIAVPKRRKHKIDRVNAVPSYSILDDLTVATQNHSTWNVNPTYTSSGQYVTGPQAGSHTFKVSNGTAQAGAQF